MNQKKYSYFFILTIYFFIIFLAALLTRLLIGIFNFNRNLATGIPISLVLTLLYTIPGIFKLYAPNIFDRLPNFLIKNPKFYEIKSLKQLAKDSILLFMLYLLACIAVSFFID